MTSKSQKLKIGIIGCGFSQNFIAIYKQHPNVEYVGICDANPQRLADVGDRFDIGHRHNCLDDMLIDGGYDAIQIMTPIHMHTEQTVAVLNAGIHCACAVTMATSIEDMRTIAAAQQQSGKKYMMLEPNAYWDEVLYVKTLLDRGEMGRIQLLRGMQSYNLNTHPPYWLGFPPMHYISHAIAPLIEVAGKCATHVHCYGSGYMQEEFQKTYGNPYPSESAIFRMDGGEIAAEVTITFFDTAVQGREGFDAYGEKASFKWREFAGEKHGLIRLDDDLTCHADRIDIPTSLDGMPEELYNYMFKGSACAAFARLTHEFITSIIEDREPYINAEKAFSYVAPGLCAHESAINNGKEVIIPTLY